jgi:hypothetical protein
MRTLTALLISVDGRAVMTLQEFAKLRGKSPKTVQNEISAKRCPVPMFKDGMEYMCHVADVARWLDSMRLEAIDGDPRLEPFREAA